MFIFNGYGGHVSFCAFLNNTVIPVVDLEISIVNQNNFILLNRIFYIILKTWHWFTKPAPAFRPKNIVFFT